MKPMIFVLAALAASAPGKEVQPARTGHLEVVAGRTGGASVRTGDAEITSPFGVAFDGRGTLYFVEMLGYRVRTIGQGGLVTTLAGTGREGSRGDDGPAIQAEFNGPHSLAVSRSGDIYVADTWNNRVRKIDQRSGLITNIAGTGAQRFFRRRRTGDKSGFRRDILSFAGCP